MASIINVEIFKYEELSDSVRKKVINHYRDTNTDMPWNKENIKSLTEFIKIFPVKLKNFSYSEYQADVFWEFTDSNVENFSYIRLIKYLWNNYSNKIYNGKYLKSFRTSKEIFHTKVESILINNTYWNVYRSLDLKEYESNLTGYYMDDVLFQEIWDFIKVPDKRTFKELLEDCFGKWTYEVKKDLEYQNSDEYINGIFISLDYNFRKNGDIFNEDLLSIS